MGQRPLVCWHGGFEFRRGHGCLSVVSVLCSQVCAIGQLLVQTSPTECGMSNDCDRGDALGQATTQDRFAKPEEGKILFKLDCTALPLMLRFSVVVLCLL